MAEGRQIPHYGEAIVLRTWPFHEADLLVSLFTREQGKVKGVARHAMRSRRRFGGALEPATMVRARYTERPRQDLVRMDSFEIVWSPLSSPTSALQLAGLQLVVEVLDEALPELAPEDGVFRLAVSVLKEMQGPWIREQGEGNREQGAQGLGFRGRGLEGNDKGDSVWLPVTYFCLWMNRLMGWWPELGHCSMCGLDLRQSADVDGRVWWSAAADGVTCGDDRRPESRPLTAESIRESYAMARQPLGQMLEASEWPRGRAADLRVFAIGVLERHLERRLRSAVALG